jgi:hypothetical protein
MCLHGAVEQRALGLAAAVDGTARFGAGCGGGHGRPDRKIGAGNCMLILLAMQERSFCIIFPYCEARSLLALDLHQTIQNEAGIKLNVGLSLCTAFCVGLDLRTVCHRGSQASIRMLHQLAARAVVLAQ